MFWLLQVAVVAAVMRHQVNPQAAAVQVGTAIQPLVLLQVLAVR
jgi:hypothetical protein